MKLQLSELAAASAESRCQPPLWLNTDRFPHKRQVEYSYVLAALEALQPFNDYLYFMCIGVLPACISVHHMCAVLVESRGSDPLDLELQTLVSSHVGAGD